MTEQLWRKCPICQMLFCHHALGYPSGMVPVAAGALLIEDGIEAATQRGQAALNDWLRSAGMFVFVDFGTLLRAAVGGQPPTETGKGQPYPVLRNNGTIEIEPDGSWKVWRAGERP